MNKLSTGTLTGLLLTTLMGNLAIAQTEPTTTGLATEAQLQRQTQTQAQAQTQAQTETPPDVEPTSESAVDLRIPARATAGYNTSGNGYDGFVNFEGFVPLSQTPGERITFLGGRFLVDNDGNVGGSVLLGHRFYDSDDNRIWGGYFAYDNRRTEGNSFNQLGLGLESLGEVWDFRFNAYLPVGDTRQLTGDRTITGAPQLTTGFQGNQFVINSLIEQQRIQSFEAATGGFDLEAGGRVARWEGGDLRGYAGLYFYDAAGTGSSLGWRLRLDADVNRSVNLGMAAQGDDIFGTSLMASVAFSFPGTRPRGPIAEENLVRARLGEPIARIPTIALDTQTEIQRTPQQTQMPLMNPEEVQPYRFWHVTLGTAPGGDGTFERPFGTMQDALNAAISDGNDIVYVDAGANPNIPAFTIPDRVRVLSQAPIQTLAGLPFPGFVNTPARLPFSPVVNYTEGIVVQLPLSGDGNFPVIQQSGTPNLVTMGDRTVLSGFQLNNATENAVLGIDVADVEIRDNQINNAGQRGIFLNNVTGSVVMFDNTITNTLGGAGTGQGLLIQNRSTDIIEATIARHQFINQRVGIELATLGNRVLGLSPQQIVEITNTTIDQSTEQGLLVQADGSGNQQVRFAAGAIANSGSQGVFIRATNTSTQEVTLENNTIRNNTGAGVETLGGVLGGISTAAQEVFIRSNVIEANGGAGIEITGNESVAQEFGIGDNDIRNNGGPGIRTVANNASFQEYVTDPENNSQGISGNRISGNNGAGITMQANDTATVVADIQTNTLTNNQTAGNPDLVVTATDPATSVCTVLRDNTTSVAIRLDNTPLGLFEVGDLGDLSANNNFSSTVLVPGLTANPTAFTNRAGLQSCF